MFWGLGLFQDASGVFQDAGGLERKMCFGRRFFEGPKAPNKGFLPASLQCFIAFMRKAHFSDLKHAKCYLTEKQMGNAIGVVFSSGRFRPKCGFAW